MGRILFLMCICTISFAQFNKEIANARYLYAPDKRVAIFEAYYDSTKYAIIGKTTVPESKSYLRKRLKNSNVNIWISTLGSEEPKYGIVNVSEANLREKPDNSSELSSQMLLGTPLRLLEKKGHWYRVQAPDKYIGWVDALTIKSFDTEQFEKYQTEQKFILNTFHAKVKTDSTYAALPIRDLSFGALVRRIATGTNFDKILLPDSSIGYLAHNEIAPIQEWISNTTDSSIVQTSFDFIGIPYLWGGTSTKGVDCSGFTRMAYLRAGYYLPRDASQQALLGDSVSVSNNFSKLQKSDLLFFGNAKTGSVTHVGMWIGNQRFIHSSGMVKISSFDPKDPKYDAYNLGRLMHVKRVHSKNIKLNSTNLYTLNKI